jgi:ferredoxin
MRRLLDFIIFLQLFLECYSLSANNFLRSSSLKSKSKICALKFDPTEFISISVNRPLGIDLEEINDDNFRGVYISDFLKDGNADKALRKEFLSPKGLFLVEANGIDVRNSDFDSAMSAITSKPDGDQISLKFIDPQVVLKGPAILDVVYPNGKTVQVKCLKGQSLRTVLLDNKIEVYDLKGKLSNCGGGGICATCVVGLLVPENDWFPKPEFEDKKLKKYDKKCRLSCNVIVEGDARVEVQPSKNG